ncbi:MAG TPA: hypothetical protein VE640_05260, partial [Candidatus Bathyarchaeia archaeon]|nr:hypothetical protein [Candidatus Bathyarchaeia archaeon]
LQRLRDGRIIPSWPSTRQPSPGSSSSPAARSPVVVGAAKADHAALAEARGSAIPDRLTGSHDWILLHAVDRAALDRSVSAAAAALASPGTLWIAFPKGSSKLQTDLTRDTGWDAIRGTDLMWLTPRQPSWCGFAPAARPRQRPGSGHRPVEGS